MNAARRARRLGWALCWLGACASAGAAQHRVVIEGMRFTPQTVQARPGDTITWENRDLVVHNVTAAAIQLRSGDLAPGQSWRYTVPAGSSFDYMCTLHPMMTGRVELEAAPAHARTRPHESVPKMK